MSSIRMALLCLPGIVACNRRATLRIPLCRCLERNSGRETQGISADTTGTRMILQQMRIDRTLCSTSHQGNKKDNTFLEQSSSLLMDTGPNMLVSAVSFPLGLAATISHIVIGGTVYNKALGLSHALHIVSRITYVFVCELY